jgi:hypothetical protein
LAGIATAREQVLEFAALLKTPHSKLGLEEVKSTPGQQALDGSAPCH